MKLIEIMTAQQFAEACVEWCQKHRSETVSANGGYSVVVRQLNGANCIEVYEREQAPKPAKSKRTTRK